MSSVSPPPESEQGPPEIVERDDVPVDCEQFTGPFFQAIGKRKLEGRDAKILVTADNAETGVGKSNFCDFSGYVTDTSKVGFKPRKVAIDPPEFFSKYGVVEKGSALVLEEGEQLDPRRAMQNENVDASHTWQMERVREIIAYINLPSPKFIDNRMEELADFWINVERRGRARVYKKKIHPTKRKLYYKTLQTVEWPNMDGSASFEHMDALKNDRLDGHSESSWVRESEVQERIEQERKKVVKATRDEWLTALYNQSDLTAREIAALGPCDVTFGRVGQIAREASE